MKEKYDQFIYKLKLVNKLILIYKKIFHFVVLIFVLMLTTVQTLKYSYQIIRYKIRLVIKM